MSLFLLWERDSSSENKACFVLPTDRSVLYLTRFLADQFEKDFKLCFVSFISFWFFCFIFLWGRLWPLTNCSWFPCKIWRLHGVLVDFWHLFPFPFSLLLYSPWVLGPRSQSYCFNKTNSRYKQKKQQKFFGSFSPSIFFWLKIHRDI